MILQQIYNLVKIQIVIIVIALFEVQLAILECFLLFFCIHGSLLFQ